MTDRTPLDLGDQAELIRRRQQARARVMALLLGGFAILVFFIALVKIKEGQG